MPTRFLCARDTRLLASGKRVTLYDSGGDEFIKSVCQFRSRAEHLVRRNAMTVSHILGLPVWRQHRENSAGAISPHLQLIMDKAITQS